MGQDSGFVDYDLIFQTRLSWCVMSLSTLGCDALWKRSTRKEKLG